MGRKISTKCRLLRRKTDFKHYLNNPQLELLIFYTHP